MPRGITATSVEKALKVENKAYGWLWDEINPQGSDEAIRWEGEKPCEWRRLRLPVVLADAAGRPPNLMGGASIRCVGRVRAETLRGRREARVLGWNGRQRVT